MTAPRHRRVLDALGFSPTLHPKHARAPVVVLHDDGDDAGWTALNSDGTRRRVTIVEAIAISGRYGARDVLDPTRALLAVMPASERAAELRLQLVIAERHLLAECDEELAAIRGRVDRLADMMPTDNGIPDLLDEFSDHIERVAARLESDRDDLADELAEIAAEAAEAAALDADVANAAQALIDWLSPHPQ